MNMTPWVTHESSPRQVKAGTPIVGGPWLGPIYIVALGSDNIAWLWPDRCAMSHRMWLIDCYHGKPWGGSRPKYLGAYPPFPLSPFPPLPLPLPPVFPLEVGPLKTARGSGVRRKLPERSLLRSHSGNGILCIRALKSDICWHQI